MQSRRIPSLRSPNLWGGSLTISTTLGVVIDSATVGSLTGVENFRTFALRAAGGLGRTSLTLLGSVRV